MARHFEIVFENILDDWEYSPDLLLTNFISLFLSRTLNLVWTLLHLPPLPLPHPELPSLATFVPKFLGLRMLSQATCERPQNSSSNSTFHQLQRHMPVLSDLFQGSCQISSPPTARVEALPLLLHYSPIENASHRSSRCDERRHELEEVS